METAKDKSSFSSQQCQLQTNSIADHQPAAPQVVLPQQSSPMLQLTKTCVAEKQCEINNKPEEFDALKELESKPPTESNEKAASVSLPGVPSGTLNVEEKPENAGHKFLKVCRSVHSTLFYCFIINSVKVNNFFMICVLRFSGRPLTSCCSLRRKESVKLKKVELEVILYSQRKLSGTCEQQLGKHDC